MSKPPCFSLTTEGAHGPIAHLAQGLLNAARSTHEACVDDSLQQMAWMQGAIWNNAHVRKALTALKEQREPQLAPLAPLQGFRERG